MSESESRAYFDLFSLIASLEETGNGCDLNKLATDYALVTTFINL